MEDRKPYTDSELAQLAGLPLSEREQRLLETLRAKHRRIKDLEGDLCNARPDPERLVLLIHSDGFVELYGETWHAVEVVHEPAVSQQHEIDMEDHLIAGLPITYRELMWPAKVVASGHVKCCPTIQGLERLNQLRRVERFLEHMEEMSSDLSRRIQT